MEALDVPPFDQDEGIMEEEEQEKVEEQDEGGMEASSRVGSSTDEETDEDSEPEPPPVIRRKVSFADAFGLNLVSVKEFDNAEETESEVSRSNEREVTHISEEFSMSCLFTVPSSPEELDERLQAQMVELETIELLPGTTILRGTIRVVNLCFSKSVYARISLDQWNSHFDLLAEYVPGSSDRKTDRFTFRYTVVPPFEKGGMRVEFCLRYETSVGTFWANNRHMNYVLFCHQKTHLKEPQMQDENSSYKSKRSCLKAYRNGDAEERTREAFNTAPNDGGFERTQKADKNRMDSAESLLLVRDEDHKSLVDSVKRRHKATRLARAQHYNSQRRQQTSTGFPHASAPGLKASRPPPAPWASSASFLHKCQKTQPNESPQVLTYHQIPLLTLDWKNDELQQWGAPDVDDIWAGGVKMTLSKEENSPSVNDMWETFLNRTDDSSDKETSVCDVWQAFLNGPSCEDHSDVPEAEWLQTATSISPSNDKEPHTQYATSSQEFPGFEVGADTPTTSHMHTLAACQQLSDSCKTLLANVALNTEDHQPAEACVGSPRDDNTVTRDASQRSQTNSITETVQEFSLKGAPPLSEDSVDSSTEYHAAGEPERGGIIGGAGEIGGDEPFTSHTADSVTSSGESETTDMTAMPEFPNASVVDRISQGARLHEGLSSSREGEVTGTAHNAINDMLAFRETIRQGTKDGARDVFSTSREGVEEGIVADSMEKNLSTEVVVFRPEKTIECEISPRYVDETQCEEFRLNQNTENQLQRSEREENEIRSSQAHTGGLEPHKTCDENFEQNKIPATESNVQSDKKDTEIFKETSCCTSGDGLGMIKVSDEQEWHHDDQPLQQNSLWQMRGTSGIPKVCDKQSWPIQACEELRNQMRESSSPTQTVQSETDKHVFAIGEGKSLTCDGVIKEQREINPSAQTILTEESCPLANKMVTHNPSDHPNLLEGVEEGRSFSHEEVDGQKEDVGIGISPGEVRVKEDVAKKDTSTKHQRETSDRREEDMSQENERVSIGELKIEAMRELMGNVEGPQGKRKNVAAERKERVLSPPVEYKRLSDGTKDPITAESLEVMELGLEEMFLERFGEDLIRGIWEEVFGQEVHGTNIVDGTGKEPRDTTEHCSRLVGKNINDTFDSGVFSLAEFPTDTNLCPRQDEEATFSPKESCFSLTTAGQTHFLAELQPDFISSAHRSQDLTATSAAPSRQPLNESAQAFSSPNNQENNPQVRERSVTCQETGRQTEETWNRSALPSHKHLSSSADKLKESAGLSWWSTLHILFHITRLIICIVLVGGFFAILFYYDFTAFFCFYMFSLSWWFYTWKRHRVTTNKEIG